jgi:hypothetical protein
MKLSVSDLIIWSGVSLGILDWLTDMTYYSNVEFASGSLRMACIICIMAQPIWYLFMFLVYVGSHESLEKAEKK